MPSKKSLTSAQKKRLAEINKKLKKLYAEIGVLEREKEAMLLETSGMGIQVDKDCCNCEPEELARFIRLFAKNR